jgi:aspartate ammonia-lyase
VVSEDDEPIGEEDLEAVLGGATRRARENFQVSGRPVSMPIVRALIQITWANAEFTAATNVGI